MINTSKLKDGDIVIVKFDNGNSVDCRFSDGIFVNIEDNHHSGEIYGSSVASFNIKKFDYGMSFIEMKQTVLDYVEEYPWSTVMDVVEELGFSPHFIIGVIENDA